MGYLLINKQGQSLNVSNSGWIFILGMAKDAGWEPAGTVLYKRKEYPSDLDIRQYENNMSMTILHTEGDAALDFDIMTRSGELDPDWDGAYTAYAGQIITAQDAANMAAALRHDEETTKDKEKSESWLQVIQGMINLLESGEVMVN